MRSLALFATLISLAVHAEVLPRLPAESTESVEPKNPVKCETRRFKDVDYEGVGPSFGQDVDKIGVYCQNQSEFAYTVRLTMRLVKLTDHQGDESLHELQPGEARLMRSFVIRESGWKFAFHKREALGANLAVPIGTVQRHGLPFPPGVSFFVSQMFPGVLSSHDDEQTKLAFDFSVPPGTPVVATADGVVALVKSGSTQGGRGERYRGRENLVLLHHANGTWSLYAHLGAHIPVVVGQRMKAGELIGDTGVSGMMGGPHLHYAVEVRSAMRGHALPVQFVDRSGRALKLEYGKRYGS